MNSRALLTIMILGTGSLIPLRVLAADSIIGVYDGKVKQIVGYNGMEGEPCVASISTAESSDGSLKFSLNDVETMLFDHKKVSEGLHSGKKKFALVNKPGNHIEIVNIGLGKEGSLKFLKMRRKYIFRPDDNSTIACGELNKR